MKEIISIRIKPYILISIIILLIIFYSGLFLYDDGTLKDVRNYLYLSILFFLVLIVESFKTKVILLENGILKQMYFTKNFYSIDNIKSISIYEKSNYLIINGTNGFIKIGWDYKDFLKFKTEIISLAELNGLKINYKSKWWQNLDL